MNNQSKELISAEQAYALVEQNSASTTMDKLIEDINAAIANKETSIEVETLTTEMVNYLESNNYKVSRPMHKQNICISWDENKPQLRSKLIIGNLSVTSGISNSGCYNKLDAPDGVYILTAEDNCIIPSAWNSYKEQTPVGIALIEEDRKLIVALHSCPEDLKWSGNTDTVINRAIDDRSEAKKDFDGSKYMEKLIKSDNPAALFCAKYGNDTIPVGKWYLPSLGELVLMQKHKSMIDAALTLCGGEPLYYGCHWSSTEYSSAGAWVLYWSDGDTLSFNKDDDRLVRPVSAFLH